MCSVLNTMLFKLVTDMLESVYPEVDDEDGEKGFRTMSSEEQMKE